MLLEDLSAVVEEFEGDLGTAVPLDAPVPRMAAMKPWSVLVSFRDSPL